MSNDMRRASSDAGSSSNIGGAGGGLKRRSSHTSDTSSSHNKLNGGDSAASTSSPLPSMFSGNINIKRVDVVVMCGSSGSRLFPLTINTPKCLLPVCNVPVLSYLLSSLSKYGFIDIILVTTPDFKSAIGTYLSNQGNCFSKNVSCVVLPDTAMGTCDALKYLRYEDKLHGESTLVIPGDAIVGKQVIELLDKHQRLRSDLTMLLMKAAPPPDQDSDRHSKAAPKKKKRDQEEVEYIGVAGQEVRLVMKTPALAVDEELSVSKTLLSRLNATGQGGSLQIRADLTDVHIFVLSRWAVDVAAHSGKIPSLKSDLIPMLIRKQFHPKPSAGPSKGKALLLPPDRRKDYMIALLASGNTEIRRGDGIIPLNKGGDIDTMNSLKALNNLQLNSSGMKNGLPSPNASQNNLSELAATKEQEPLELCRCYAHIIEFPNPAEESSVLCTRAVTVQSYLESNRMVSSWENSVAASRDPPPWGALKGLRSSGATVVGTEVVMDGKVQMRQSIIGNSCVIGGGVKLNDSVIMDGVQIGAGSIIQNSVICAGATIGDGVVLKNCQVAAGFNVPAQSRGTDECFNELGADEDEIGGEWEESSIVF